MRHPDQTITAHIIHGYDVLDPVNKTGLRE